MLFDSHCHLTDERLRPDADAVVERARAAGVERLVTVGADAEDWDDVVALAERHDGVYAAAGVHPHIADHATAEVLGRLRELARHPRVVALGEAGLDFHYDLSPRAAQRRAFAVQLALAAELALPLIVHSREADDETADVLRADGRHVRGVLHCFSGGRALLDEALAAGWYVSFSGIVTFAKYEGADLVRAVPADRLLIETDSPYLAPVPVRGKRNEPAFVRHVAEGVARLRGQTLEEVAALTRRNADTFYGLAA